MAPQAQKLHQADSRDIHNVRRRDDRCLGIRSVGAFRDEGRDEAGEVLVERDDWGWAFGIGGGVFRSGRGVVVSIHCLAPPSDYENDDTDLQDWSEHE